MRKKRVDSTQAMVESFSRAAAGLIEPPECVQMPAAAMPFWDALIATKAPELWSGTDLVVAANLARISCEIEQLNAKGVSRIGEDGKPSAAHRVLTDLTAQQVSLCRALQIHSRAIHGEARENQGRNRQHRLSSEAIRELRDDPYIAWPENDEHLRGII